MLIIVAFVLGVLLSDRIEALAVKAFHVAFDPTDTNPPAPPSVPV